MRARSRKWMASSNRI